MATKPITILCSLITLCFAQGNECFAEELKGKAVKKNASQGATGSGRSPLQGGIKDEASLNPSLKLIPGKGDQVKNRAHQGVIQFKGGREYGPDGNIVPSHPSQFPTHSSHFPNRSGETRVHYIKPITSYYLTPRNGIMTFGGHEVVKHPSSQRITTYMGGGRNSVNSYSSHNGVATFAPKYGTIVHHTSRASNSTTIKVGNGIFLHNGLGSNHHSSLTSIFSHHPVQIHSSNGVTSWAPGFGVTESSHDGHSTSVVTPGHGVTRIAYSKGVSSWAPGYEVSVHTNTGYKTSLGGMWFEKKKKKTALAAQPAGALRPGIFVEPVVNEEEPLLAKANLLPQLSQGTMSKNITWHDWFRSVASSIYTNWANTDIGPGTAKARVTVTRKRDISCEIVDFIPAPFVERDMDSETKFKIAAFNAVREVKKREIPSFPPLEDKDMVTFDVVLKRTVDGPIGIDVTKL